MAVRIADISVVAANYNNGPYLEAFFESVVSSTVRPRELLFVDDGSTDNSMEVVRAFEVSLPELKVIALERNVGFGNALNVGISLALGRYIARIDPDDQFMPTRLEEQVAVLESGRADVVGSNAIIFHSASGRELGETNFPPGHDKIERVIRSGAHGVLHPTVMAVSRFFKEHPYRQGNVPAEDYDVFARMLVSGARFENIQRPLLRYRVHQASASNKLPFSTISKTFSIRDGIFGTSTNKLTVLGYYVHIKSYRKYLFSSDPLLRLFYGFIAAVSAPSKLWARAKRAAASALGRG